MFKPADRANGTNRGVEAFHDLLACRDRPPVLRDHKFLAEGPTMQMNLSPKTTCLLRSIFLWTMGWSWKTTPFGGLYCTVYGSDSNYFWYSQRLLKQKRVTSLCQLVAWILNVVVCIYLYSHNLQLKCLYRLNGKLMSLLAEFSIEDIFSSHDRCCVRPCPHRCFTYI